MAYVPPTPADLKAIYPAFASVDDAVVQTFLDRANGGDVDESWAERDFAPAIMAAAAHRMARAGHGTAPSAGGGAAAGVESFKSGDVSIQFSSEAVKLAVSGGWGSSGYGQDYVELLMRNHGGPRVVGGGRIPCAGGFNGFAGPYPPLVG